jgi:hypothetical protein
MRGPEATGTNGIGPVCESRVLRNVSRALMYGGGLALGPYAAYVGSTYLRYGDVRRVADDEADTLLDSFMPSYDVVERHLNGSRRLPTSRCGGM